MADSRIRQRDFNVGYTGIETPDTEGRKPVKADYASVLDAEIYALRLLLSDLAIEAGRRTPTSTFNKRV